MIKKLACAALAALLVAGTSAVVAGAAESDEAVAAKSEAEAVGADETDSDVGAEADSESTGSDSVIYFDASSTSWSSDTIKQGVFFFLRDFKEGQIITWGSKKGKMTDEGGGKYSYDLGEKGIELQSGHNYAVNFAAGSTWGVQTCDLIFGEECFGHTASCTGEMVENNMDSNKKSEYVIWDNGVDRTKYAPPMIVTSIGNIVGEVPLTTKYDLMVQFLKETLTNAREYAQKSDQELLDGIAEKLDLSQSEVERAINEAGVSVDWKSSESSAPKVSSDKEDSGNSGSGSGTNSGSSSVAANNGSNSTAANNSTNKTTGSTSSGSTGSSGTGTVSSGQETTLLFALGGMSLAAAGIIFLSRKKKEY